MEKTNSGITREIRKNFITGFLIVLPIAITLWVIWFFISKIIAFSLILLPKDIPLLAKTFWSIFIIILSIIGIIVIGITTRNVVGRKLIDLGERLIHRIPVAKWIYETVKKISETFLGQKLKIFKKVVLVEYPRKGIYSLGFMTSNVGKGIVKEGEEPHVNVFIPTTPNPTSGFLIILPEKDVVPLDIPIEEAFRYIVSVGNIPLKLKNIKK